VHSCSIVPTVLVVLNTSLPYTFFMAIVLAR